MARPQKDPNERRDETLGVRLTVAERVQIERAANTHGITPADFLRRVVLAYPLPPPSAEREALDRLAAVLLPIGVNLNQIARATNAGRDLPGIVRDLAARISALLDELDGARDHGGGPQL
jgi:hypothetical protein